MQLLQGAGRDGVCPVHNVDGYQIGPHLHKKQMSPVVTNFRENVKT